MVHKQLLAQVAPERVNRLNNPQSIATPIDKPDSTGQLDSRTKRGADRNLCKELEAGGRRKYHRSAPKPYKKPKHRHTLLSTSATLQCTAHTEYRISHKGKSMNIIHQLKHSNIKNIQTLPILVVSTTLTGHIQHMADNGGGVIVIECTDKDKRYLKAMPILLASI